MLSQASIAGTDDWFLVELATEAGLNFKRLGVLRRYREGDAPLPDEAAPSTREAYRKFMKTSRLHVADLIVSAKVNRQKPVGFRTAAAGDDLGDTLAWANWKRSHMQVGSRALFADVGHYGTAYLTTTGSAVAGSEGDYSLPIMVPSNGWTTHSRQLATAPWLAEAAIKWGYDPVLGADTITLFRRGYMRTAIKKTKQTTIPTDGSVWSPGNDWTWTSAPVQHEFTTECLVVRLDGQDGKGQYENHLNTLDRINSTILQRVTITAMQAFKQRVITGDMPTVYPDDHERAGQTIDYNDLLVQGPGTATIFPEGVKISELSATDITPILNATKDELKHLSAVTSTPLYVLQPDAAAGSATGAAVVRETLIFAVEDLNERASDAFATVQSLMFQAMRDTARSDPAEIETIWASIDRASILERASASVGAKQGGMPQRMIDEKIFGLTPAEIRQARQDRQDEAFDQPAAVQGPVPSTPRPTLDPAAAPPADDLAPVDAVA